MGFLDGGFVKEGKGIMERERIAFMWNGEVVA